MRRLLALLTALAACLSASIVLSVPQPQIASAAQSDCHRWLRIIDVSNWQPSINWSQVAKAGVAGAYVEYGDGTWRSPTFASQVAGAASVGIPWGAYYFARPNSTDPLAMADEFTAAARGGTLPPVLDLEDSSVSGPQASAWAQAFLVRVAQDGGRVPTIYTGGGYAWSSDPALSPWPLWIAAYPAGYNPVPDVCALRVPSGGVWGDWSLWQFTSVGAVWGVAGNVDLSAVEPAWWETYTGAGIATPGSAGNRYPAPIYGPGSVGSKVRWIQRLLVSYGISVPVDGRYGDLTAAGVYVWQARFPGLLAPDGVWGPATEKVTQGFLAWTHRIISRPVPVLKPGDSGRQVRHLQKATNALGINVHKRPLGITGHFGPDTLSAVEKLRSSCGLPAKPIFSRKASACLNRELKKVGR